MNRKIFIILCTTSLLYLVTSAQTNLLYNNISLQDNETFVIKHDYYSHSLQQKESEIAYKYFNKIIQSPLMRSVGIQDTFHLQRWDDNTIIDTVSNYLKDFLYGNFTDEHSSAPLYMATEFYSKSFSSRIDENIGQYFHKFIKIKKVREFSVKILGDMLIDFCKVYPKDFKQKIITTLQDAKLFILKIPQHKYTIINGKLFTDGVLDCESVTMKGFIIRRILTDKIPREEILGYINNLLTRIQTVDVSKNKDVLEIYNINDEFEYIICCIGNYLQNKKSKKKYSFLSDDIKKDLQTYFYISFNRYRYPAYNNCFKVVYFYKDITIKYFKDINSELSYYTFQYKDNDISKITIDNKGNVIR